MKSKQTISLALASMMAAGLLAGCGSTASSTASSAAESTAASSEAASSEAAAPADTTAAGKVYYLNFKPEQDEAWQALAKTYTEETGVPVTVVTAASGQYETTLMSEMAKSDAPTLFQVNGPVGLANWKDYCYDLTGSKILGDLTSDSYALKDGDATVAIGYVIESYGLITNKTLLEKAGYTTDDIKSFADLKKVAEDITARKDELGFAAFTSAGMDSSSDWRFKTHLANLPIYFEYQADGIGSTDAIKGTYLDNYKNMFDLYINNSTCAPTELAGKTGDDSRNEFLDNEAVFYQNGSWEYTNLVGDGKPFTDDDLTMIPVYIGVGDEANQGLCTGTENYWCVNKEADQADIDATLDFMYWCVSSDEGTKAMANDMGFVIPFKNAQESPNLFVKVDNALTAEGKTPVAWCFSTMPSENWKNGVGSALTAYAAGTGDWNAVVTAFVDGWKTEAPPNAALYHPPAPPLMVRGGAGDDSPAPLFYVLKYVLKGVLLWKKRSSAIGPCSCCPPCWPLSSALSGRLSGAWRFRSANSQLFKMLPLLVSATMPRSGWMIPSPMRSGSLRCLLWCPRCSSMCWRSALRCCLPAASAAPTSSVPPSLCPT